MTSHILLVTGGARSGKSRYALARAATNPPAPVLFVATGLATDDEMAERIARHRAERPPHWRTLEARYDLARSIATALADERRILVEDLATVVSNLLIERQADEHAVRTELDALLELARERDRELVLVTNEVGLGVVPPTPLGRRFRDLLGLANQQLADAADEVVMLVSGLPLRLK